MSSLNFTTERSTMKVNTIYLTENGNFSKAISAWAESKGFSVEQIDPKTTELYDLIQGVALFHENHNFSKEDVELHEEIIKDNIPGYKIDLNGTLVATVSNFTMWLERNKPNKLLILGNTDLAKNKNLERFLEKL